MSRNILLLVTGMTPQIVTETLYGLAVKPEADAPWIPTEIRVLSTQDGLNQVRDRLFNQGHFAKMQADYPQLADITFNNDCLHVIQNTDGVALADLKTPQDNQCAANAICEQVRHFTAIANTQVHVSIAGGRKTMGFYAGYALTLYGGENDRMSHVLVEDRFESVPDFYYPTPRTHFVTDRSGKTLDASTAQVWLANIPFVRLRSSLAQDKLVSQATFSEVIKAINMANQPLTLTLNIKAQTLQVGDTMLTLAAREFAFYWWFAHHAQQGLQPLSAPKKELEGSEYADLSQAFLQYYTPLKSSLDTETIQQEMRFCMDRAFFDDRKTALSRKLKGVFGRDVAEKIGISSLMRQRKKDEPTDPRYRGQYQINLDPQQILIIQD